MGNGMNKIVTGLYLGNFKDAKDEYQLQTNGITHIISIHEFAKPFYEDKKYLCIIASDKSGQNILQHFSKTNDFIHEARSNGCNVLVHCLAGVSRSATIVIAYLMSITGLTWKECLAAVQFSRPCANPNFGFQRQLLEFQYEYMAQEQKRLLERFPHSNDSFINYTKEVKIAAEAYNKQLKEKENLRQDVCNILARSDVCSDTPTDDPSDEGKDVACGLKNDKI